MTIPLTQLERHERRAAKARLIAGMQAGLSWKGFKPARPETLQQTFIRHV